MLQIKLALNMALFLFCSVLLVFVLVLFWSLCLPLSWSWSWYLSKTWSCYCFSLDLGHGFGLCLVFGLQWFFVSLNETRWPGCMMIYSSLKWWINDTYPFAKITVLWQLIVLEMNTPLLGTGRPNNGNMTNMLIKWLRQHVFIALPQLWSQALHWSWWVVLSLYGFICTPPF